jgi:hypothetical protein
VPRLGGAQEIDRADVAARRDAGTMSLALRSIDLVAIVDSPIPAGAKSGN